MYRSRPLILLLLTLISAGLLNAATHQVNIMNSAFMPSELTIQPGDSVIWTNDDSMPHTVTATDGSFDSNYMPNGATFSHVFESSGPHPYVCLYHSNMTGVVQVGEPSGGDTIWTELTSPTSLPLLDIRFWDSDLGWIAGQAGLLRTTNGGDSWTLFQTADDAEAVFFISESEGWACGNDGMILHSTNGGVGWSPQNSGVGEKLRDIWFADENNGWACGRDGLLIHTTDGGQSWSPQSSPATDDLRGIHMLDGQTGWIVGSDGLIMFTSNAGQNWETQLSVPGGEEDEFEAVFALDADRAWAVGGQGRIYATNNGGESWDPQSSGTTVALMDVHFRSLDNGWVCGGGGFLAQSSESGSMWHTQTPPVVSTFNSVFFVDGTLGFLVTGDGRIFRRADVIEDIRDPNTNSIVASSLLASNYPNPFNPATTIDFTIPMSGLVTLQVFDVLGREVETLVNRSLTAGSYSVPFVGLNEPSGIYFYRLNAGGQVFTRTMTLLK